MKNGSSLHIVLPDCALDNFTTVTVQRSEMFQTTTKSILAQCANPRAKHKGCSCFLLCAEILCVILGQTDSSIELEGLTLITMSRVRSCLAWAFRLQLGHHYIYELKCGLQFV